ncbi:GRIP1-associated protein 1 isoform X2 [Aplysia californica]|uniref:GRIP1-associated protein 1 isoform X2 n=1 Tax=Aplysia californica TaxID=6500 RepID=A0ABM1VXK1_APLCA|nr:GRIP1-associated protein 1 isoform X2 [Aplysia californica]
MASALSEDEFHRMQLQLIELRTTNYELEGKNKKLERDLSEIQEKTDYFDRELAKAKQAINKSKKAKDVELLLQESDSLQRKLVSQEEEFRLQNQTLMEELGLLVSSNEEMKKELEAAKSQAASTPSSADNDINSSNSDELRRLQAENAALQKNLTVLQEKYEEVSSSKNKVSQRATSEAADQLGDESNAAAEEKTDDVVDGSNDRELQLELDTEREEKRILKAQLEQIQRDTKTQIAALQEEVDKGTDRLKKKQESFMQVQSEKETLFKESNLKLEESQAARDRDQKYYKDQIVKLQQDAERNKKEVEQSQMSSDKETDGLKSKVKELQKQVDASNLVTNHQLQEQGAKYIAEIDGHRANVAKLTKERDDLTTQLQESRRAAQEAVTQLHEAQTERDSQISAMQEVSKVAEKRKSLLDELAIKYQKEYDDHRQATTQMEADHAAEKEKLETSIEEQSKKIAELNRQLPVIEELNKKVSSLDESKGWLERRLKEVEDQLSSTTKAGEEEREEMTTRHKTELEELTSSHAQEVEGLKEERRVADEEWVKKEEVLKGEVEGLKNKENNLRQAIKDNVDEKKIHEKKGMTMLKDLKRQLHAERKRAEKLQLRLQEVLSDTSSKGMEDLFRSSESGDFAFGDTSSVSSWGAGASGLGKDSVASGPQSPMSGNNSMISEGSVGEEYNDLLKRVAVLQQDKWGLEEKVNHLEMSNACMAEDILNKTSIIEHYVMDSRSGPKQQSQSSQEEKLSLKKVMDMVNKNSEHAQHTQDMNKKLQSMLEETLTKNMHLQQDLELMSQEVVRLSKLSAVMASARENVATVNQPTPPSTLPLETKTTTTNNTSSSATPSLSATPATTGSSEASDFSNNCPDSGVISSELSSPDELEHDLSDQIEDLRENSSETVDPAKS